MSPNTLWRNVFIISMILLGVSALSLILSFRSGTFMETVLLLALVSIFAGCAYVSHMIRRRYDTLADGHSEVTYFKLKKPGLEVKEEEEIVPKGKMPGS